MSGPRPTAGAWGLAFLGTRILLSPLAGAAASGWPQLLAAFEQRGFAVRVSGSPRSGDTGGYSHLRCNEPNLFGLYLRSRQLLVICPRGNRVQTLMHEGWHAIQDRCLRGAEARQAAVRALPLLRLARPGLRAPPGADAAAGHRSR